MPRRISRSTTRWSIFWSLYCAKLVRDGVAVLVVVGSALESWTSWASIGTQTFQFVFSNSWRWWTTSTFGASWTSSLQQLDLWPMAQRKKLAQLQVAGTFRSENLRVTNIQTKPLTVLACSCMLMHFVYIYNIFNYIYIYNIYDEFKLLRRQVSKCAQVSISESPAKRTPC